MALATPTLVVTFSAKDLDDLFTDQAFWQRLRKTTEPTIRELFTELFLHGANLGRSVTPVENKDLLPLDPNEINEASQRVIDTYFDEWWGQFVTSTQNRMRGIFTQARIDGSTLEAIIEDLAPLFGRERAMRIAATETTRLFGLGAQATYARAGIEQWSWQTVNDPAVDPICRDLQDRRFPIATPFSPAHVNCLVAGTIVSGPRFLASTRRWYEGEGIVIRTALGDELTVTPNHPIATLSGWVAASALREGDEVLCQVARRPAATIDPYDVEVPTPVEEVAGALLELREAFRLRVPSAPEDFHGDGIPGGEVDVVGSACLLARYGNARRLETHGDNVFKIAFGAEFLSTTGALRKFIAGDFSTTGGRMGVLKTGSPRLGIKGAPLESFRSATIPRFDAFPYETTPDRHPVDPELFGERLLGHAALIESDNRADWERLAIVGRPTTITSVRRIRIVGHVYNLETREGWYLANGIITGNCRCFPRPVTGIPAGRRPPRERRPRRQAPEPEQVPAEQDFPTTDFKTVPEIERFMRGRFPETFWSFTGLEPRVANAVARQVAKLSREWPGAQQRLHYVGTNRDVPADLKAFVARFRPNIYAHVAWGGRSMSINPKYFGKEATIKAAIRNDVEHGWHPRMRDPEDYISIITHEWGHVIDAWLSSATNRMLTAAIHTSGFGDVASTFAMWKQTLLAEARRYPELFARGEGRGVFLPSQYAFKNDAEAFAELYSASIHGAADVLEQALVRYTRAVVARLREASMRARVNDVRFTTDLRSESELLARIRRELAELAEEIGLGPFAAQVLGISAGP